MRRELEGGNAVRGLSHRKGNEFFDRLLTRSEPGEMVGVVIRGVEEAGHRTSVMRRRNKVLHQCVAIFGRYKNV